LIFFSLQVPVLEKEVIKIGQCLLELQLKLSWIVFTRYCAVDTDGLMFCMPAMHLVMYTYVRWSLGIVLLILYRLPPSVHCIAQEVINDTISVAQWECACHAMYVEIVR